MTREEAIDRLKEARVGHKEFLSVEAIDMAIKALEQESCEDAINRQAIMDDCKTEVRNESLEPSKELAKAFTIGMAMGFGKKYDEMDKIMEAIKALTPQQKTGRWMKHNTGHWVYYDCSLCGCVAPHTETVNNIFWKIANYCPDCGAKME